MSALTFWCRLRLRLGLAFAVALLSLPAAGFAPEDVALDKQCGAPVVQMNGDISVDCLLTLAVQPRDGPMVSDIQFALQDVLTDASGTAQPGWISNAPGCLGSGDGIGWDCAVPSILWQDTIPDAVTVPLTTITLTIPAGTEGPLENCVSLYQRIGFPVPGAAPPMEVLSHACAAIELPVQGPPPVPTGAQCQGFTAEVTCDPASGLPLVTLTNTYSSLFAPGSVHITSLSSGVSVAPGSGALSVILTGANPGDVVHLFSEAVAPGAGSAPGLDLCCMGEIEVQIPTGLQCTTETVIEVEKTCTPGEYPSGATVDCEISVSYSGPPPTDADPLTISDAVGAGTWSVVAYMGSSDDWACGDTPHTGPEPWVCSLSAEDAPGADWSNFTSTLVVQMSTEALFENCVEATGGAGEDTACWSNLPQDITISKTGPETCDGDGPCDYLVTLTAGPGGYYGPVLLSDQPPTGFDITAIAPPVAGCTLPADPLACIVGVGLTPGASQTYTISITRDGSTEGPLAGENCAALHGLPAGPAPAAEALAALLATPALDEECVIVTTSDDEECPEGQVMLDGTCTMIDTETPAYTLTKTCEAGDESILCTITLTTNGVPFVGAITVSDESNLPPGSGGTITAPVGLCVDSSLSCSFTAADLAGLSPPNTVAITVTLDAAEMVEGFMNCAQGEHATMGPQRDCMLMGEFEKPRNPPPPNASCSSDYLFVVDSSGSIGANAGDVSYAVRTLSQILNGMGSQGSLILFNSNASVAQPMSATTLNAMANNYGMLFTPSGATNWEAALSLAATQANANTTVIFITDGRPTAYVDGSGNPVILPDGPGSWLLATNEAIPAVDLLYSMGVPIIGVGIAGPGEGGFVSTYLDALLGTSSQGSTFGTLNADMTALAHHLCAGLHLTKLINGQPFAQVNFHNITGDSYRLTVTLRALNSTGADLTNVVIEDLLPASLTNPGNVLPAGPPIPVSFSGQNVTWTVPLIAAGATESVTFDVDLARPAEGVTSCSWQSNFAQVMSLTGLVPTTPGNMSPAAGPAAEPDESLARFCAIDRGPNPPADCTDQWLEVQKLAVEESCFVGQPCEFTVTVRPRSCLPQGFSGPVMFADSITPQGGGAAVPALVTAITNTASPPVCAFPGDWTSTSLPTGCQTPIVVPANTSVSFTVTVNALSSGSYTNCFVAQDLGLPATPAAAIAAVGPQTLPITFLPRGNCVDFSVSAQVGIAPETPSGDTPRSSSAVLTLAKTPLGPCRTSNAQRRHECDFALTVSNTGTAPFAGPLVLSDQVTGITPTAASVRDAQGWTCGLRGASASCVNGSVMLEPGQSTGFVMTLTLPGAPRASQFAQCASIGVGPGEAERTLLMQRIMQFFAIDGGPVDGISGRQTRAGLRQLSERLGLPSSETISPALLAALGLGEAGAPTCVTVDLPAIRQPATPTRPTTPTGPTIPAGPTGGTDTPNVPPDQPPAGPRCDPQSTVRVGDSCECRAPGMVRRSATTCGCPQGTQMVGALGCVGLQLPGVIPRREVP